MNLAYKNWLGRWRLESGHRCTGVREGRSCAGSVVLLAAKILARIRLPRLGASGLRWRPVRRFRCPILQIRGSILFKGWIGNSRWEDGAIPVWRPCAVKQVTRLETALCELGLWIGELWMVDEGVGLKSTAFIDQIFFGERGKAKFKLKMRSMEKYGKLW